MRQSVRSCCVRSINLAHLLRWGVAGWVMVLLTGCPAGVWPPDSSVRQRSATIGETVVFNADSFVESNGETLSYQWGQTSGPPIALPDPNSGQLVFVPNVSGEYVFTLTVTGPSGSPYEVTIRVSVAEPQAAAGLQADAGPDQTVLWGSSVVLTGAASGGTPPCHYLWTPTDGLDVPTIAHPTASPTTTTVYTLTVTDSAGAMDSDSVTVSLGTPVSGVYWSDTTWTLAQSPYVLVGDVQVPQGITLTIEPGVAVRYQGSTQIYVRGTIIANGTPAQPITFAGADPSAASAATFIEFGGANLSASQLSDVVMAKAALSIRIGNEAARDRTPKNTGILAVTQAHFDTTQVKIDRYETNARLAMRDCELTSSSLFGLSGKGGGEVIRIDNSTVAGCRIVAHPLDAVGAKLSDCTITDTEVDMTGGNTIEMARSSLTRSRFVGGNFGLLKLDRCECTNVGIFPAVGEVAIVDCSLSYDELYSSGSNRWGPTRNEAKLTMVTGTIEYSVITGNGVGAAIELWHELPLVAPYPGALTIDHCTIHMNETGVRLRTSDWEESDFFITNSNLQSNTFAAVENQRVLDASATKNYWGTNDGTQIPLFIHDYFDDIALGKVAFEPFATAPIADAGPRP